MTQIAGTHTDMSGIDRVTSRQLRVLVTVVEEASFGAAADVLGLSQSGVSHAVAQLEQRLGARLLDRRRDGAALTDAGQQVLPHLRAALSSLDAARQASQRGGRIDGVLRVGSLPSVTTPLLGPLLQRLAETSPDIDVVLLEGTDGEVASWLEEAAIDLAVIASLTPDRDGRALGCDRFVGVVPASHPHARHRKVELAQLTDLGFIASRAGCEPFQRELFRLADLTFEPRHAAFDATTLLRMVAAGLGATAVPELLLDGHDLTGLAIRPLAVELVRHLHLVSAVHPASPAADAFCALLPRPT